VDKRKITAAEQTWGRWHPQGRPPRHVHDHGRTPGRRTGHRRRRAVGRNLPGRCWPGDIRVPGGPIRQPAA